MGPETRRLLGRVSRHIWFARAARRFTALLMGLLVVYIAWLFVARLTAVFPDTFNWRDLPVLAVAAAIAAVITARRPRTVEVAHILDERAQTKDLYLTAVQLDGQEYGYSALVFEKAENSAPSVSAGRLVTFGGRRPLGICAGLVVVALAAIILLPTLDPFGRDEERVSRRETERKLEEMRKRTLERLAVLKPDNEERNPEVDVALRKMQDDVGRMKPENIETNRRRLKAHRDNLGEIWKKMRQEKMADALERRSVEDRFGAGAKQRQQWKKEMDAGDASGLKKEIEELKDLVEKMQGSRDKGERTQAAKELKKRLENLSDFAEQNQQSQALSKALQNALDQLAAGRKPNVDSKALQDLAKSLDLTQAEIDKLADNIQDMNRIQDALEGLRQADQLNDQGRLDGQQAQNMFQPGQDGGENQGRCPQCGQQQCPSAQGGQCQGGANPGQDPGKNQGQAGEQGEGRCPNCGGLPGQCPGAQGGQCNGAGNIPGQGGAGAGMGGPGQGRGGIAPEDESVNTRFTPDLARSHLTAGKYLLEWQERAVNAPGDAPDDYDETIETVKKGLDEAILHEEVPPAYQDAVRKYFDTLGEESDVGEGKD